MLFKALTVAAAVGVATAQRPNGTSICDYYTTALLKNNTAANQKTLLTLVVNTVVIGNYTEPNVGIAVPGILAPGMYNGTAVNLAGYFNGGFASTNRGGDTGESVNFLDDGGAAPLLLNMPANGTTSNQFGLLSHLYEYFGTLLGCSEQGKDGYAAYSGSNSMYTVHKFMALSNAEVGYFITQVALAGASFGVTQEDLAPVGEALAALFGHKCAPEMIVVPTQPAGLQSICTADDCPTAENATCASYAAVVEPKVVNATLAGEPDTESSSSASGSSTATGTAGSASTHSASASATSAGGASATSSTPAATVSGNAGAIVSASYIGAVGAIAAALFL